MKIKLQPLHILKWEILISFFLLIISPTVFASSSHSTKLTYYKHSKSKATYTYTDGSKIILYTAMYKGKGGHARYYAAHILLAEKDYSKFSLAKANGKRSHGFQSVLSAVRSKKNKAYHAALAVNGPFNGADSRHWIRIAGRWYGTKYHNYYEIAGGKYYKGRLGSSNVGDYATYCNKTGILAPGTKQEGVTSGMSLSAAAKKKLISDTFAGDMGIELLKDRKIQRKADHSYRQRTFIGTNGKPGDLWIVVANGQSGNGYRHDINSKGLNMYGAGAILKKLGCSYGYNLDGGGSSTMVFKGKIVTKNWTGGGRPCYDMLYVRKMKIRQSAS